MPKTLSTSNKILFVLNFFGDFLSADDPNPLGIFSSGYSSVLSFTPNRRRRNNFQQALSRLLMKGYIRRARVGGLKYYRLTAFGRRKLFKAYPNLNFRLAPKWDGYFRIATFDVSESERQIRNLLRETLTDFGFARLQQSFYISPFRIEGEVASFLKNTRLAPHAHLFTAKFEGSSSQIAEKVWSLSELNDKYRSILKQFERTGNRSLLREKYLEVACLDPYLPDELLPEDWLGHYLETKVREVN